MSTFNTAFGSLPTPADQYGVKPASGQPAGLRGLRQPLRPRTFSDLRKSGEARPAPPAPGLGNWFGVGTARTRQQNAVSQGLRTSPMSAQLQQLQQERASAGPQAVSQSSLQDALRAAMGTTPAPTPAPMTQMVSSALQQPVPSFAPVASAAPEPVAPTPVAGGRGGAGGDMPVTTNAAITAVPASLGADWKDQAWLESQQFISPEEKTWWNRAQQLGKQFGFTPMQSTRGYGQASGDGRTALYANAPAWGYGSWMSNQAGVEVPDANGRIIKLYETAPQEQFVAGLNTIASLAPEDLAVLRQVDGRIDELARWASTANINLSTPEGVQAAAAQASYDIGGGAANENIWGAMNAPAPEEASGAPATGAEVAPATEVAGAGMATPGAEAGLGGAGGTSWQDNLNTLLQTMLQNPSGYQDQDFERIRDAARANLAAEFGGQQEALNEELARRGIYSSSIAAGRLGDLAGQQARAMTTMETDLLRSMAETLGRDRSLAAQAGLDYMKTLQNDAQFQQDIQLRTFQIMEDSRLRGLGLSLEQARDLAQQEQFGKKLNQDWAIASMEASLRERLGLKQLELDELRLNNENFWNDKNWMLKLADIIGQGNLTPEQLRALGLPTGTEKTDTNATGTNATGTPAATSSGVPNNAPSSWPPPAPGEPTTRMWGGTKYTYNPILGWTWLA